jgi:AraC-like DNA-binding protein
MHERVANPWTVESLAAACGMSRSAFALRFKEMLGETLLEYLTSWENAQGHHLARARRQEASRSREVRWLRLRRFVQQSFQAGPGCGPWCGPQGLPPKFS